MLSQTEWEIEKAKLVQSQDDIQATINYIDSFFYSTNKWDTTTPANNPSFSNNDLTVAATNVHAIKSTEDVTEFQINVDNRGVSGYLGVGVVLDTQDISSPPASLAAVPSGMWLWRSDGYAANNGSSINLGNAWSTGDVISVKLENGNLSFARNGSWVNNVFSGLNSDYKALLCFMGNAGSPVASGVFSA